MVAYERLLVDPGEIVVGAAAGSADVATAYEFALNLAYQAPRKGAHGVAAHHLRHAEAIVGHLGLGGVGTESYVTDRLLKDRGIDAVTGVSVRSVNGSTVVLSDGRELPYTFCHLTPPLRGPGYVRDTPRLADRAGYVKVDHQLQHPGFPEVFAAGSSVGLLADGEDGVAPPRGGRITDGAGRLAAHNVVATVLGEPLQSVPPEGIEVRMTIDAGE